MNLFLVLRPDCVQRGNSLLKLVFAVLQLGIELLHQGIHAVGDRLHLNGGIGKGGVSLRIDLTCPIPGKTLSAFCTAVGLQLAVGSDDLTACGKLCSLLK